MYLGGTNSEPNTTGIFLNSTGLSIGTTTPAFKLDVMGSARANGFLLSTGGSYTTGSLYSDGNWGMLIRAATNNPIALCSFDDTKQFFINTNGNVGIGTQTPSFLLTLNADSAAKPATSTWTVSSDKPLKKDIIDADLDMCYENVKNIPLRKYKWKDYVYSKDDVKDRSKLGFIADEIEKIFPKSVETREMFGMKDCKTLNTDQLLMALFGAVQRIIQKLEE